MERMIPFAGELGTAPLLGIEMVLSLATRKYLAVLRNFEAL